MINSQTKAIVLGILVVFAVVGVLLFTTSRSNSNSESTNDVVFSGNRQAASTSLDVASPQVATDTEIIKEFLPRGGTGAACTEEVGVQVTQGYSAKLTINGIKLKPEELNVILGPDGNITNEITATRSKGQFSFAAEPDCPNGKLVRPTENLLRVCVYESIDPTERCIITETHSFDAI